MSLDPPTYLASLQSNIRQRPIPWEGQVRSGTLSEEQYGRIRAIDKTKKIEQKKEIVEKDIDGYRLLFVGGDGQPSVLESAGKHANVVQYILVFLSDILDGKALAHAFTTSWTRKAHVADRTTCTVYEEWRETASP